MTLIFIAAFGNQCIFALHSNAVIDQPIGRQEAKNDCSYSLLNGCFQRICILILYIICRNTGRFPVSEAEKLLAAEDDFSLFIAAYDSLRLLYDNLKHL